MAANSLLLHFFVCQHSCYEFHFSASKIQEIQLLDMHLSSSLVLVVTVVIAVEVVAATVMIVTGSVNYLQLTRQSPRCLA